MHDDDGISNPSGNPTFDEVCACRVNIQHPGETASERSDPDNPSAISAWPDGGRPRSATLAIRRIDGGLVGS